ncbi:MAG: nucleoside triphosphate pyrophosphohydrolase [Nitriliruptoraceae bacterium]
MTAGPADDASPSVALVETSELFPGLLPFQAWDVLGTAEEILVRDAASHPAASHLHLAGLDLETVEPATLERHDLDLSRPGLPDDRRMAKALVERARRQGRVVYLLGPKDERLAAALAGMAAEHDLEIELVFLAQQPAGAEVLRLVEVMRRLRDPATGCPWDLEQDHTTLLPYLVEETYELVEAIETGDEPHLLEELGDVLLQVVFHARIARDRDAFGIDEVARGIADKLVRRHPHVFAEGDASTAAEVQDRWDRLKAQEKGRTGPFDGVPAAGPGLELLRTLQRKAARRGLSPPDADPSVGAVEAAARACAEADQEDREAAVGRLLSAVVGLAGSLDVDPEAAARAAAREQRRRTEAALEHGRGQGEDTESVEADHWQRWWEAVGDDVQAR